jgi:tetratricopeptide (TPR) repeat protein
MPDSPPDADADSVAVERARVRRAIVLLIACTTLGLLALFLWAGWQGWKSYRVRSFQSQCTAARSVQDWKTLEAQAQAWAWWQPELALPWVYAAMGAQQQGKVTQAAAYLQQIPDEAPQAPESLLALVDLQFHDLNKPFEAEATCQRILRIDPAVGEAHRRLIFFYGMTLQRQKMARQARQAIARHCDIPDTYVHLLGADWLTFSNAYDLNGHWLQNDPDNELLLVARALHFVGAKALDGTTGEVQDESGVKKLALHEKVLTEYLARFPRNLELLSYFLNKACLSGKADRVIELLARAPPEAVEDNRFWRFKGWVHAAQRQYALAEDAYRHALQLNPYDWHSQHELADLMRRLKKPDQVEMLQALALEGKQLRKAIMQLPNVQDIPTPILRRMAAYAGMCGDTVVSDSLSGRIAMMRGGWPANASSRQ